MRRTSGTWRTRTPYTTSTANATGRIHVAVLGDGPATAHPRRIASWRELFQTPDEAVLQSNAEFGGHAVDELLLQATWPGMSGSKPCLSLGLRQTLPRLRNCERSRTRYRSNPQKEVSARARPLLDAEATKYETPLKGSSPPQLPSTERAPRVNIDESTQAIVGVRSANGRQGLSKTRPQAKTCAVADVLLA